MAERDHTDSTGRTVAIVGGGALLLSLLWHGKGWSVGKRDDDGRSAGDAHGVGTGASASPPPPCRVRIDGSGLQLDGAPADLPTVTDRCRAAGSAEVRATGAAITGVVAAVVQTLQAAGVRVYAASDVWTTAREVPPRRRP